MTYRNKPLQPQRKQLVAIAILFLAAGFTRCGYGQQKETSSHEQQLQKLQQRMDVLTQQLQQAQKEIDDLRKQIKAESHTQDGQAAASLQQAIDEVKEQQEVQQAEIAQQQETKVETSSKYPLTIHGLLLFNSFLNDGGVDSVDLPLVAIPVATGQSNGNVGATLRQTILGLHAEGPHFWHARTSADLDVDFFGGLSNTDYTSNAGVLRFRTADLRLDWKNNSIFGGFDSPIFSHLSPTSYARSV